MERRQFCRRSQPRRVTANASTCLTHRPCANVGRMNPAAQTQETERAQLRQCLQGDPAALAGLREQHHASLGNILRARGASATETEELLADLWGDCVPRKKTNNSQLAIAGVG